MVLKGELGIATTATMTMTPAQAPRAHSARALAATMATFNALATAPLAMQMGPQTGEHHQMSIVSSSTPHPRRSGPICGSLTKARATDCGPTTRPSRSNRGSSL